jgi:hypothetical protein
MAEYEVAVGLGQEVAKIAVTTTLLLNPYTSRP